MKKVGYSPGQGRTFTPSVDAKWTEQFNQILIEQGISRNKLTEKFIIDGLKSNNSKDLSVPLSVGNLSEEQINLLKSEAGQALLLNLALAMLNGSGNINMFTNTNIKAVSITKPDTNVQANPMDETKEEPVAKGNTEAIKLKEKNSPAAKALAMHKKLRQNIKE